MKDRRTFYWMVPYLILGGVILLGVFLVRAPAVEGVESFSFVSGTEYNVGEAGQIVVEARYPSGLSAFNISPMDLNMSVYLSFGNESVVFSNVTGFPSACRIKAWYPDKSLFLEVLANESSSGNQFTSFVVPNVTGVYEYQAICNLNGMRLGVISKSFHVSEFQNESSSLFRRPRAEITK